VVGDLALRVEKLGAAEVLVNSDGIAVTGVGPMGTQFGEALFEGPQFDGTESRALGKQLKTLARAPLDRTGFVQALRGEVAAKGLAVEGSFNAQPAGEFKWRAIPTSANADSRTPPTSPDAAPRSGAAEIDATRPATR